MGRVRRCLAEPRLGFIDAGALPPASMIMNVKLHRVEMREAKALMPSVLLISVDLLTSALSSQVLLAKYIRISTALLKNHCHSINFSDAQLFFVFYFRQHDLRHPNIHI